MEVTIKTTDLELKSATNNGYCNLHCTVQTASDKFVESSLLKLDVNNQLSAGREWPTFTYQFQKQYMQMSVTFLVSTVTPEDNQEEIGKGFSPLVLSSNKSESSIKETILKSRVGNIPLFINIGKIIYKVSFKMNRSSSGGEGPQTGSKYWLGLSTSRQNLPLLNDLTLVHAFSEVEETQVFLKMREEEQKMAATFNCPLMPNSDNTVTAIFHTFASSWNTNNFNPVACLVKGEEIISSSPSANWFWNELETPGELKEGNIMKVVNLKIQSPLYQSISLYLFKDDISGPVFHATEPLQSLAPFCYHHRGWLQNISQPTVPSDSFIHNSIHVLSSIHLLPSKEEYEQYEGFELLVTDLTFDETTVDNIIVLGAQITRVANTTRRNLMDEQISEKGFTPSFLKGRGNEHTGADNFKMSLYNPSTTSTNNWKAYFFHPENESIVKEEIEDGEILVLGIHICIIDQSSSLPWWYGCHHYRAQLPIDAVLYNILIMDDINGIKWSQSWERSGDIQQCSVEIALRWKPKEYRFLSPSDHNAVNLFHDLSLLLHNPASQNVFNYHGDIHEEFKSFSQQSLFNFETHRPSSIMTAETQRPTMVLSAPSKVTFDMPETDSVRQQVGYFNESSYNEALQTLSEDVLRLKYKNEQLEQEKVLLADEINQLKTRMDNSVVSPLNMAELDNLVKPDLVHKIVLLEKELEAEKKSYRQKVQALQNELIQKNDTEAKFDRTYHEQEQVIVLMKRKVEKYRKCFKMAIQQEEILTKLEELILQLPRDHQGRLIKQDNQRDGGTQHEQKRTDENGQEKGILSTVMDPLMEQMRLHDNGVIHDTQIHHAALRTMDNEIVRLRQENNQLHSHLTSIIKAFESQTRKQNDRKMIIENEGETTAADGVSEEQSEQTTQEQLLSF